MSKTEFESVEDLSAAIRAVVRFAEDAAFGTLFELTHESDLFHVDDSRLETLCEKIEPTLTELWNLLSADSVKSDEISDHIYAMRAAVLTIGIFIGFLAARPSDRLLQRLVEGCQRAYLAQPRYQHLAETPTAGGGA